MNGIVHRCTGCVMCTKSLTTVQNIDRGPDTPEQRKAAMAARIEQQVQRLLADQENDYPEMKDWYGGREITQGRDGHRLGCTHRRYTEYTVPVEGQAGKFTMRYFCRNCGRWMDTEPMKP